MYVCMYIIFESDYFERSLESVVDRFVGFFLCHSSKYSLYTYIYFLA